jgi:flagellin
MRAQITGLEAASKNVKDGVSLVKTAEGAMQEIQDMLNRMVSLATQSANGTYDNEVDRANLQKEVDQLRTEIDRIADSSNFNGINLLDGSMEAKTTVASAVDATLTVKADGKMAEAGQAGVYKIDLSQLTFTSTKTATGTAGDVTFTIGGATVKTATGTAIALTGKLTAGGTYTGTQLATDLNNGQVTLDNVKYNITASNGVLTLTGTDAPASAPATALDIVASTTNGTTNQGNGLAVTVDTAAVAKGDRKYAQASMTLTAANVKDGSTITIGDTTYTFAVGKDSAFKGVANVVDLTDIKADDADIYKTAADRLSKAAASNKQFIVGSDITTGKLTFTEKEGGIDYEVNDLAGKATSDTDGDWSGLIMLGTADPAKTSGGLTLQIGDTSASYNQLRVSVQDMHSKALGIDGIDIGTQAGAQAAVDVIKTAINTVSSVRGDLGATQNRLEHTANNLSVMTENIQDAESTIRDTDIAEEMMSYTKNNILVQSAQAMLAQANSVPQGVLQLLQ